MRMKIKLLSFVLLIALSLFGMNGAMASKPGVPWRVSINALEVESGQVEVTVVIDGDADMQDLVAKVTSHNAILLEGNETWKLAVHKGESLETSLRYRYVSTNPVPQWRVVVSGSQQSAMMSQVATARLIKNAMQKIQPSHGQVRQGAEEYRSD